MSQFPFGMTGFWLILMIIMIIVEAAAPGLVSIWFAVGSLSAMISAMLHAPVWLQITLFIFVSLAALLVTRPLARKYINGRVQPTNADMIIGKECLVTEPISNLAGTGAISVAGKTWTARTDDDSQLIPAGSRIVVERIEGVKAIVKKIDLIEKED